MVRDRLTQLQGRSWIELTRLPDGFTEDVVVDGMPARMTTSVEAPDPDRRWIVVQLCAHIGTVLRIFPVRQCFVEGFEATASGGIRWLLDDEMQKYQ